MFSVEEVSSVDKPLSLSPIEIVYKFCLYKLWIQRLAYDTALANHLLFTIRKIKPNLFETERKEMHKMLNVTKKSVADDMSMVAKIGIQSRELTSSRYFRDLQGMLGHETVEELRVGFGSNSSKKLESWKWKIFRRRERKMLQDVEQGFLRLLYWRYIIEEFFPMKQ